MKRLFAFVVSVALIAPAFARQVSTDKQTPTTDRPLQVAQANSPATPPPADKGAGAAPSTGLSTGQIVAIVAGAALLIGVAAGGGSSDNKSTTTHH